MELVVALMDTIAVFILDMHMKKQVILDILEMTLAGACGVSLCVLFQRETKPFLA